MSNTVLVIEDEPNLLAALEYTLVQEGFEVLTANDGESGLNLARTREPDLLILDVMLPSLDGFEICRIIRRESNIPILMLTARGEEVDRVVGLELGADDYVTKPFSMRELLARIRSLLRRASNPAPSGPQDESEVLRSGDLTIDLASHSAMLEDKTLDMKPREFSLLSLLAANRGRAFTRDQILERLWGHDYIGDSRTVDVHVRWLREKIEPEPSKPQRISNYPRGGDTASTDETPQNHCNGESPSRTRPSLSSQ